MIYLNLDLDYFTHPKTVRLVGLLGKGAEVLPIRLWCYCGKYHVESGRLTSYSIQEIEATVGWWGKSGEMVKAMLHVGFLDEADGEFQLHDWEEHEGHLLALRERGKTAAKARWEKTRSSNATSNAKEGSKQCSLPSSPSSPKENPPYIPPDQRNDQRRKDPRRAEDVIPFWKELVDHIDKRWLEKKKTKFYWDPKFWKSLKNVARTYQPWGVMALWDLYIASDDDFVRKSGYAFPVFLASIPRLVDDPVWKRSASRYELQLNGPIQEGLKEVLQTVVKEAAKTP